MLINDTQSISIAAAPEVVLDFVGEAGNLPDWAPVFAQAIEPSDGHWIVQSDGLRLQIDVRVSRELGTVDFLAAGTPRGVEVGAFSRVVQNGEGSDYIFTRFYDNKMRDDDITRAKAVVTAELHTVKERCEALA